jgi:hypothetical protein
MKHTEVYTARKGAKAARAINAQPPKGAPAEEAEVHMPDEDEISSFIGLDVTDDMQNRLNKQFQSQGVEIQDIMIQNISLPSDIEVQMSNKTLVRSKQEYEVMEQTFEMQSIRLKNDSDKLMLEFTEKEEMARVQGQRDVQASRDHLLERKAERDKSLADYTQVRTI